MARANYELIDRQRDDLMKAYREIAPNCHSQQEAWEKVVHSPAPRYYVSPKRAWDILRRMAVGDFSKVDSMKPIRQKLYYTLFNRMNEMTQRKEFVGKSLWFICQFLVSEPAPEFFIQPSNLKFIFAYYKKYGKITEKWTFVRRNFRTKLVLSIICLVLCTCQNHANFKNVITW